MSQIPSDGTTKEYQNIGGLIGTLVGNRLATLNELRTIYTLEDAMDIYESYIVPKFNEWKAIRKAEGK